MSYPQERYHGTGGSTSAAYRVAGQPPDLPMKASAASYLATGTITHGQFGLYRWDFTGPPSRPGSAFPPIYLGVVLHPRRHGAAVRR
jgi:hypothetical protein